MNSTKENAVLYARVSSQQQVENTSLDFQEKMGIEHCERFNMNLSKIFREEGESAKFIDRPELQSALKYCSDRKNNIKYLLIYRYDRFSRDLFNHLWIEKEFNKHGVSVVSMSEPVNNSPDGKLHKTIIAAFAEYDNDVKSMRTINGLKERLKAGYWPFKSPLGYKKKEYHKDYNGPKLDIPDPEKFDIVKKGWERMLTGSYSQKEVALYWYDLGLRDEKGKVLSPQSVSKIFKNKFYAGFLRENKLQEEQRGLHQAMITEVEFNIVQNILNKKSKSIIGITHLKHNEEFPLNKLIKCRNCGRPLSGALAKKNYAYYACRRKECQPNLRDKIKKKDVEDNFINLIDSLAPTSAVIDLYSKIVDNVFQMRIDELEKNRKIIKEDIDSIQIKMKNLEDLALGGGYTPEEFKEKRQALLQELSVKTAKFAETDTEKYSSGDCLKQSLNFLQHLPTFWENLDGQSKQKLHSVLFPQGIKLAENGFTTDELCKLYKASNDTKQGLLNLIDLTENRTPITRLRI